MTRIPDNYINVVDRVVDFTEDHPDGRIETEATPVGGVGILMTARLYRTEDSRVHRTGHALATATDLAEDKGLEKTETAAVGRALSFAGYPTKGDDAGTVTQHARNGHTAPRTTPVVQGHAPVNTDAQEAAQDPHGMVGRQPAEARLYPNGWPFTVGTDLGKPLAAVSEKSLVWFVDNYETRNPQYAEADNERKELCRNELHGRGIPTD
jgi:hypothetical protein